MSLTGKHILVLVGGGIAAYKIPELVRRLRDQGATVRCAMTAAAQNFVTPFTLATVSGQPVPTDLFEADRDPETGHIRLARDPDLILVAPATANLMAKVAAGIADDLATTTVLATTRPVLMAPAMNPTMWSSPATQRNRAQLRADGIRFVGPESGAMAERDESGTGRMAGPQAIIDAIAETLAPADRPLAGKRIIVTSGPTREAIDPIRFISNHSSGRQGHAIAAALATLGADVHLVTGPVQLPDPAGVTAHHIESARDMEAKVDSLLPADAAIFAAAVGDWRMAEVATGKLKKTGGAPPELRLLENPDILAGVGNGERRPRLVVGFAAETSDLVANARIKLAKKGADLIVANDVSAFEMGGARNAVTIVSASGAEPWPELDKDEVAARLARLVAARLTGA
jgi:phosphopantothenoylcysteine decarboxylase/phosphopantothenate--cysteine ligase